MRQEGVLVPRREEDYFRFLATLGVRRILALDARELFENQRAADTFIGKDSMYDNSPTRQQ